MRPVVLMILTLAICGGCNSGPGSSPQQASKPVEPSKCEIASMTNADSPWQYSEKKNEMDGRETTIAGLRNFGTGQQIILRCSGSDLRSDALCSRGNSKCMWLWMIWLIPVAMYGFVLTMERRSGNRGAARMTIKLCLLRMPERLWRSCLKAKNFFLNIRRMKKCRKPSTFTLPD